MQALCDCSQGRSIASPHRAPEWQANGYLTLECCAVNSKQGGQQTGELLPKHLDSIESPACKDIQSSTCLDATQGLRSGDLGLRGMWRFTLSNSHHSANGGGTYGLFGIAGIQCKRRQTQVFEFFSESWDDRVRRTRLSAVRSPVQRSPPRRHRLVGAPMDHEKDALAGLMSHQPTVREPDASGGAPMLPADSVGAQTPGWPGRHRKTLGRIPVLKREPTSRGMAINRGPWLVHAADLAEQLVCAGLEDRQSALY